MKRIVLTMAFILGVVSLVSAQKEYRKSLNGIKKVELEASAKINVVLSSGNEIVLDWGEEPCENCDDNGNYNESPYAREQVEKQREKKKGMRAIYASGVDNTGLGMQVDQDGEVLRIKDLKPITQTKGFTVRIPKGVNLSVNTSTLGSVTITGFTNELEITSNVGHVKLIDVTGPVTASTSTGAIDVIFTQINQTAPISLTTATGDIDVSLPNNAKASVEMRTTMGTVYSNFDLETPRKDGMKVVGSVRKIAGDLNNGGVTISLTSSVGDIYLRKKS